MTLWTLEELLTKVKNDLDLNDETMISETTLIGFINQAIDECEQLVISEADEDYFLQSANLALVSSQADYTLPTNIYANKIRLVSYDNGSDRYEIKRIRDLKVIPNVEAADQYRYIPYMDSTGAFKFKLYPASRETSSANITIWFVGNANTLAADDDILNIPEAAQYIIAKTKLECCRFEGHPNQVTLEPEVERQRQLLVATLQAMVPDEDNEIILDPSIYDEMF